MVNLKWDFTNWVTIGLMVLILWSGAGLVKSLVGGSPLGQTPGG